MGQAASLRESILVEDVRKFENYIDANPNVKSELAVPLIHKNRVVGVIDLQSESPAYFTEEHQRLLELTASRMAILRWKTRGSTPASRDRRRR